MRGMKWNPKATQKKMNHKRRLEKATRRENKINKRGTKTGDWERLKVSQNRRLDKRTKRRGLTSGEISQKRTWGSPKDPEVKTEKRGLRAGRKKRQEARKRREDWRPPRGSGLSWAKDREQREKFVCWLLNKSDNRHKKRQIRPTKKETQPKKKCCERSNWLRLDLVALPFLCHHVVVLLCRCVVGNCHFSQVGLGAVRAQSHRSC